MRNIFIATLMLAGLLSCEPAFASKIQQQGIKTAADCTAAGAALGNCLPLDSQIWLSATTPPQQLSTAITAGAIGGGGGNSGKNYLSNSSFESNSGATFTGWTVSGATASANTTNFQDQAQSISLALSASGSLLQDVTTTTNLQGTNLEMGAWVNTSVAGITVCARVNAVNVSCNAAPASGTWTYVSANAVGPALGTSIGVAVVWTATTGTVLVDHAYVGGATNLSQVSQAQWLGSISFPAACSWSQSTGSTFTNFPATTGCTPTVSGSIKAPSTLIPGFVIPNYGIGNYKIVGTGFFYGTNAPNTNAYYQYSDGTNVSGSGFLNSGGVANIGIGIPNFTASINNTTPSSNVTIQVQSAGNASISDTDSPTTFDVYYFPTQSQTAVQSKCSSTGTCVNHLSASVAYACTSSPCTIASQNVPWLSSITRTSTGLYVANISLSLANPLICSITPQDPTAGASLIGVLISATSSAITFQTLTGNTATVYDTGFSISCDKQGSDISSMSAPVLVGSVTSNSSGAERTERIKYYTTSPGTVCSSSTCNVSTSTTATVTRSGTGSYVVTYPAFSAIPACNITPSNSSNALGPLVTAQTTTTLTFTTNVSGTGTPVDTYGDIICMGPR